MTEHLHHKLAVLHQNLLHGKLPRSMRWVDALELVGHLGQVHPQGGDEFAFIVGAERELFKRPHGADLAIDEVSKLRKFLKAAGSEAEAGAAPPVDQAKMVVVIDHHAARIFKDLYSGRPEEPVSIEPHDPHHFHHHLIHRKEAHYAGDRVPEETSFYQEVADSLVPASEIVLIGHGVGKSSAVEVLHEYLKTHHPAIAQHVKAIEVVDLSALTDPQIEALARKALGGTPA